MASDKAELTNAVCDAMLVVFKNVIQVRHHISRADILNVLCQDGDVPIEDAFVDNVIKALVQAHWLRYDHNGYFVPIDPTGWHINTGETPAAQVVDLRFFSAFNEDGIPHKIVLLDEHVSDWEWERCPQSGIALYRITS